MASPFAFLEPELDITAPPVSESYHHGHVLSAKSRELQRDTFFFAPMGPHPARLVLGKAEPLLRYDLFIFPSLEPKANTSIKRETSTLGTSHERA
jgi:hypothetical protein